VLDHAADIGLDPEMVRSFCGSRRRDDETWEEHDARVDKEAENDVGRTKGKWQHK